MANTTLGYESAYTGQEIDAAVDAVLGGGGSASLPERAGAAEAAIASLECTVAVHSAGISALQETVAGHTAEIETLDGRMASQTASVKDTLDSGDLDITDESGNVLARFSGGHIKVKHFDSSSLDGRIEVAVETALEGATGVEVKTNMESSDLCLTDDGGNILARLSGGHIETKGFDSRTGRGERTSGSIRFTVEVECGNPVLSSWATATGLNDYTGKKVYADNCVLKLPLSYTPSGVATKLIIYCKQGGSQVTMDSDVVGQNVFPYLLHLGYAVLAVDGMPDGLTEELRLDDTRVVGNYVAVSSVKAAYDYVMENWNLDKRGAFIWGYSQGGHYAQNVIDLSGIHFYAAAELSPVCSMRYHQWDLNVSKTIDSVNWTRVARLNIARLFGFPQVSTNEELLALEYDADKVAGYDPWTRNVEDPFTGFTKVGNLWRLPSGTSLDSITMRKHLECPLKIWCAENDSTLSPDVMKVFVKAVKNAGQVADMHVYSTGGHGLYASQTAIGTFDYGGTTYNLYPLALEVAVWYSRFGGYAVDFESNNN